MTKTETVERVARLKKLINEWDRSGAIRTSAYWRLVSELTALEDAKA